MLNDDLKKFGLDDKESDVYLALLELGEGNVGSIAKKSGVKRTTTYSAIASLIGKGLISASKKNKKKVYLAENPKKLEQTMEEKKTILAKIMPELLAVTNIFEKKPEIRFFEGAQGIKEIYKDMLNYPNQAITSWFTDAFLKFEDQNFFNNYFIPKRVQKKIWVRAIVSSTEPMKRFIEEDVKQLRRTKQIPAEKAVFKVEISLYGGYKTSIVSFAEKMALIIESKDVYTTLKSIFEINWELIK